MTNQQEAAVESSVDGVEGRQPAQAGSGAPSDQANQDAGSSAQKLEPDVKPAITAEPDADGEDGAADFHMGYLLAEMIRVELLVKRQLTRLQVQGNLGGSGLVVTPDEVESLLEQGIGLSSQPRPGGAGEEDWQEQYRNAQRERERVLQQALDSGVLPRLAALFRNFSLDAFEQDVFLVCLLPFVEPRYERVFGYLLDDLTVRWPTVHAILSLLTERTEERLVRLTTFLKKSRLFRHRLLRQVTDGGRQADLPGQQLGVDESVATWLLGEYQPNSVLQPYVELNRPIPGEREQLLTAEIWSTVSNALNGQTMAFFHGEDVGIQEATARILASGTEMLLLDVDLGAMARSGVDAVEALRLVLRDARLVGAVAFLRGWAVATGKEGNHADRTTELVQVVFDAETPVIVSTKEDWYAHGVDRREAILRVNVSKPSYRQRKALWQFSINQIDHRVDTAIGIEQLSSQFTLTSQQIQDAVTSARDMALQRNAPVQQQDLIAAARIHSSPSLSDIARKIEPRYEWDDIVLPEDQKEMLREMIATVRGRGIVMEEWGVGQKLKTSSGVTVLFAGPPGTGKTMSAEVITGELGLDLYKIDLSMVVSKYIGETEKNLGKIFDEAQSSSAVLFFDEADAVFGKRSEVKDSHDRYANMEVSYLLQRMELYDGVTILATNLRANMDDAFTRRMQFVVDFPFPDEEDRLHIWRTLLPDGVPRSDDIDLELLAARYKLAGGSIRNIIAGAAFLAAANGGEVTMSHLLHSTRRELQKMGRLISDVDLSF